MDYSRWCVAVLSLSLACDAAEDETSAEGGALEQCPAGSGEVEVQVTSVATQGVSALESGSETFELACSVASAQNGATSLELTCAGAPGQADTEWTLSLSGPAEFSLPLVQSDAVEMTYVFMQGFEVGSRRELSLSVDGEPILYAYSASLGGGTVGHCGPGEEREEATLEAFLASLGLVVERGSCDPVDALRLAFDVDGETTAIHGGQDAEVGASGWSVAAGAASCISQEDDPEITGSDFWEVSVLAWKG